MIIILKHARIPVIMYNNCPCRLWTLYLRNLIDFPVREFGWMMDMYWQYFYCGVSAVWTLFGLRGLLRLHCLWFLERDHGWAHCGHGHHHLHLHAREAAWVCCSPLLPHGNRDLAHGSLPTRSVLFFTTLLPTYIVPISFARVRDTRVLDLVVFKGKWSRWISGSLGLCNLPHVQTNST